MKKMKTVVLGSVGSFALISAALVSCKSRQFDSSQSGKKEALPALGVSEVIPECRKTGWDLAEKQEPKDAKFSSYMDRAKNVADCFLTRQIINLRISDTKSQILQPQMRPWERNAFDWKKISKDQLLYNQKSDPNFYNQFLSAVLTASEVEAPVNSRTPGYGGESFFYIQPLFPKFAEFVGGKRTYDAGNLVREGEKGVWEQEEFGHSNHFKRVYKELSGAEPAEFKPQDVSELTYTSKPVERIKKHLQMRISAEVSATVAYIWMLSHTTGDLQRAIAQPFEDELGHLAKFWGFYRWAFKESNFIETGYIVTKRLADLLVQNSGSRTDAAELTQVSNAVKLEIGAIAKRVMETMAQWDAFGDTNNLLESTFTPVMDADSLKIRNLPRAQRDKLVADAFQELQKQNPVSADTPQNPILFNEIIVRMAEGAK
jgi:hypothetical protein